VKFEKGNTAWMYRVNVGRPIKITPEELLQKAQEYFDWCDDNPIPEIDYRGKDATPVTIFKRRPYQKEGCALWVGYSSWERLSDLSESPSRAIDFREIITRIAKIVETQQKEGSMAGQFNPMIVSRIQGLSETVKHDTMKPISITIQTESDNDVDNTAS